MPAILLALLPQLLVEAELLLVQPVVVDCLPIRLDHRVQLTVLHVFNLLVSWFFARPERKSILCL